MKSLYSIPLLFVFLLVSCNGQHASMEQNPPHVVHIKTATVTTADMQEKVTFYGEVRLRNEVVFASQFDGRLADFTLLPGDVVKEGEHLGIVIPPMREALLQHMKQLTPELRKLVADEVKEIPLISPVRGTVLKVFKRSGDVVSKGEPLARIADLRYLDIYAELPARAIPFWKKTDSVSVSFIGFRHQEIKLPPGRIVGNINPKSQTATVRIPLANFRGDFYPGLRVEMTFAGIKHEHTPVIPRSAMLEEEGIYSVFLVKNNRVEKRKITTGIKQDDRIEVLSGLKPGDVVASGKVYSLTDDMEVAVR